MESARCFPGLEHRCNAGRHVSLDHATRSFGVLCSLSSHGAFIEMSEPSSTGTLIDIEFGLRDHTIQASARVIYRNCREEHRAPNLPIGAGLLFVAIDQADQQRIREFVKHRAQQFTA